MSSGTGQSTPPANGRDAGATSRASAAKPAGAGAGSPSDDFEDAGAAGPVDAETPIIAAGSGTQAGGSGGVGSAATGAAGAVWPFAGAGAPSPLAGAGGIGALLPDAGPPVSCTTDADCVNTLYNPICDPASSTCMTCPTPEQIIALVAHVSPCLALPPVECNFELECIVKSCATTCDAQ